MTSLHCYLTAFSRSWSVGNFCGISIFYAFYRHYALYFSVYRILDSGQFEWQLAPQALIGQGGFTGQPHENTAAVWSLWYLWWYSQLSAVEWTSEQWDCDKRRRFERQRASLQDTRRGDTAHAISTEKHELASRKGKCVGSNKTSTRNKARNKCYECCANRVHAQIGVPMRVDFCRIEELLRWCLTIWTRQKSTLTSSLWKAIQNILQRHSIYIHGHPHCTFGVRTKFIFSSPYNVRTLSQSALTAGYHCFYYFVSTDISLLPIPPGSGKDVLQLTVVINDNTMCKTSASGHVSKTL